MLFFLGIVGSLILLIATIRYPPLSLAFFLMAGTFKLLLMRRFGFLEFFDFSLICALFVMVAMMYSFVKNRRQLRDIISIPLVIYLLIACLLLLGLAYTSAPNYGFAKSWRFATMGFIAFFAPIVFASNIKDLKPIVWVVFGIGIMFSIFTIAAPRGSIIEKPGWERAGFMGVGPLGTALRIAMGAIIAFCFALTPYTSKTLKIGSILLMPLMFMGIIVTGSRGPFFGLMLCMLLAMFIYRKYVHKIWLVVVSTIIIAAVSLLFMKLAVEKTIRFRRLLEGTYEAKSITAGRLSNYIWTLKNAGKNPILGNGTGAWAADRGYGDTRNYPHNIILELLYEQGLVGALLIILLLWLTFKRWRQASKLVYYNELDIGTFKVIHVAGLLFLLTFLESMKTGDINDNRWMFFCAGMSLAAFYCVRYQIEEIYSESEPIANDWQQVEGDGLQETQVLY